MNHPFLLRAQVGSMVISKEVGRGSTKAFGSLGLEMIRSGSAGGLTPSF